MTPMPLPPAELLSLCGMATVALFAAWKLQLAPRLARRRALAAAG